MNDYRGYISTEHTVWCGGCPEWKQAAIPTKAKMMAWAQREGWVYTRRFGWLCASCKGTHETAKR